MANRIVGNVIIIDSAMGNNLLIDAATGNFRSVMVASILLSMADTSATLSLSQTNTADIICVLNKNWAAMDFGEGVRFESLKVPVLTNGTAWIYMV